MLDAMTLSQLAGTLHGHVVGDDARFHGVSIDSRAITAGDLFVALAGPRFDGHDYLDDVAATGAVAALVQRAVPGSTLPQLVVADTRLALGQLGALNRAAFSRSLRPTVIEPTTNIIVILDRDSIEALLLTLRLSSGRHRRRHRCCCC